jgi:N-methylhydantoinase A/oxoprolinase/acetone carboxylase beta subunit/DUF917 family protein
MKLFVGVDVGSTSTDCVLYNPRASNASGVLHSLKTPTTRDITSGIVNALDSIVSHLGDNNDDDEICAVMIGTTHFLNAILERRSSKLNAVCVMRLCGASTRALPPLIDWPQDLAESFRVLPLFLAGGKDVGGNDTRASAFSERSVREAARIAIAEGIDSIVISSPFSVVNDEHEVRAKRIVVQEYVDAGRGDRVSVTLSSEIGSMGFLARENSTILSAALVELARETVSAFRRALINVGLAAVPLFLLRNDGTLMASDEAERRPVLTFSSACTNSIRGAGVLTGVDDALVADIGGCSCDIGSLERGFPRQAGVDVDVAGVSTNFQLPALYSFALGGSSTVHIDESSVRVGPESVGYLVTSEALVFGGSTLTSLDCAVRAGFAPELVGGDPSLVAARLSADDAARVIEHVVARLDEALDAMRTSSQPLPVILVGGGAAIIPPDVELLGGGRVRVLRPEHSGCANAVGAVRAQIAAERTVAAPSDRLPDAKKQLESALRRECIASGADSASIEVHRFADVPVAYVSGMTRIKLKLVGDLDIDRLSSLANATGSNGEASSSAASASSVSASSSANSDSDHDDDDRVLVDRLDSLVHLGHGDVTHVKSADEVVVHPSDGWILDEIDVHYVALGSTLLACGGGGNPRIGVLMAIEEMRMSDEQRQRRLRVLPLDAIGDDQWIGSAGAIGSPVVLYERLCNGAETRLALRAVEQAAGGVQCAAIAPFETGGFNGIAPFSLALGANLPLVDCDFMGRAFPVMQLFLPFVFGASPMPFALADENGTVEVYDEPNASVARAEELARAGAIRFGMAAGVALPPLSGATVRRSCVPSTISKSWRIGREIVRARTADASQRDRVVANVCERIGAQCALSAGKIVELERRQEGGFTLGKVRVASLSCDRIVELDFQNEFLLARFVNNDNDDATTVASVPDLISLVDSDTCRPILTEDLLYGLRVSVLVLAAAPIWRSDEAMKWVAPGGPIFKYPAAIADTCEPCGLAYTDGPAIVTYDAETGECVKSLDL